MHGGAAGSAEPSAPPKKPEEPEVVRLPMKLFADRLFVPVTLNGETECECLVDTGSETTLLNRARVNVKNLRLVGTEQLEGAELGRTGVERVKLDSLALGSCVLPNVTISALRHGKGQKLELVNMLIGMDILSRCRFTLDFENSEFLLWATKKEIPKAAAGVQRARLPVSRASFDTLTRPRVYATVNGKTRTMFLVDTGGGPLMFVAARKLEEYGLKKSGRVAAHAVLNDGGKSRQLPFYSLSFDKLSLDCLDFAEVPAQVLDASTVAGPVMRQELPMIYNIIGTSFMKHLKAVHFDMVGRTVYLDRPAPEEAQGSLIAPRK